MNFDDSNLIIENNNIKKFVDRIPNFQLAGIDMKSEDWNIKNELVDLKLNEFS